MSNSPVHNFGTEIDMNLRFFALVHKYSLVLDSREHRENKKNSETSPWEIANKNLTVIDIDMRFLAKVWQ